MQGFRHLENGRQVSSYRCFLSATSWCTCVVAEVHAHSFFADRKKKRRHSPLCLLRAPAGLQSPGFSLYCKYDPCRIQPSKPGLIDRIVTAAGWRRPPPRDPPSVQPPGPGPGPGLGVGLGLKPGLGTRSRYEANNGEGEGWNFNRAAEHHGDTHGR